MIQDHQGLFDSLRTDEPDGGHQVDGRYLLASASQKVLVPAEKKRQISFVKSLDHKIAGRIAELLLMNNIHGSQLGWGKRCNILHPVNALTVSKERRGLVLTNPSFVKQLVRLAYTEKLLDWEGRKEPKKAANRYKFVGCVEKPWDIFFNGYELVSSSNSPKFIVKKIL